MAKIIAPKSKLNKPAEDGKTKIPKGLNPPKKQEKAANMPLVKETELAKAKEDSLKGPFDRSAARAARKPDSMQSMTANPGINTAMGGSSKAAQGESMGGMWAKTGNKKMAVATHKQSLQNIKDAPKPNLPKSETPMAKAKEDDDKTVKQKDFRRVTRSHKSPEEGVHTSPSWQPEKGKSFAGTLAREAHTSTSKDPNHKKETLDHAKEVHGETINELRRMPKPNLPKSEAPMAKNDEPHAPNSPQDLAHDVKEHTKKLHTALHLLDKAGRAKMMEHLRGANKPGWDRSEANKEAGDEHSYHAVKSKYMEKCGMSMAKEEGDDNASTDMAMSENSADKLRKAAKDIAAMAQPMAKADEDRSKMSGKTGMVRASTEANGNQKGVHQVGYKGSSGGISQAGSYTRDQKYSSGKTKADYKTHAKDEHKKVLAELKAQPKPNLPKSEAPMAKAKMDEGKTSREKVHIREKRSAVPNKQYGTHTSSGSYARPSKEASSKVRFNTSGIQSGESLTNSGQRHLEANQRSDARNYLSDAKKNPKPNLPKSEMEKAENFDKLSPQDRKTGIGQKEVKRPGGPVPMQKGIRIPPKGSTIKSNRFTVDQVNKLQEAGYKPTLVDQPKNKTRTGDFDRSSKPMIQPPAQKPMKKAKEDEGKSDQGKA